MAETEVSEERITRFRREKIGSVFQFYNLRLKLTATENDEMALVGLKQAWFPVTVQ